MSAYIVCYYGLIVGSLPSYKLSAAIKALV